MYLFINALIVALLMPTGGTNLAVETPSCRAEIRGQSLVTVVELPTGVAVEGPWKISQATDESGEAVRVLATLDHVVETDALTGGRNVIAFPRPVSLQFEGRSQEDVVRRAARVWCVTVMRAQENQTLDMLEDRAPERIAALARARDAA